MAKAIADQVVEEALRKPNLQEALNCVTRWEHERVIKSGGTVESDTCFVYLIERVLQAYGVDGILRMPTPERKSDA